jgi:hypothetical protein
VAGRLAKLSAAFVLRASGGSGPPADRTATHHDRAPSGARVGLVAWGLTKREAAAELFLYPDTISTRLRRARRPSPANSACAPRRVVTGAALDRRPAPLSQKQSTPGHGDVLGPAGMTLDLPAVTECGGASAGTHAEPTDWRSAGWRSIAVPEWSFRAPHEPVAWRRSWPGSRRSVRRPAPWPASDVLRRFASDALIVTAFAQRPGSKSQTRPLGDRRRARRHGGLVLWPGRRGRRFE